jgi:hypothetical protein
VTPVIDKTFPFDQVKQAFAHMESGAHFGKVAMRLDEPRHTKNGSIWSHATLAGSANCFRRH